MRTPPAPLSILGVPVHPLTYELWLDLIAAFIAEGSTDREITDNPTSDLRPPSSALRPRQVCTANPEFVMTARRQPQFMAVLQNADLVLPDGVGLLWAAKRQGGNLPERVTGSDGIYRLAERAAREGWRLFLLGAGPGIAERAGVILQDRYPGLIIAGTFAASPADAEYPSIRQRIKAAQPDVLLVAYGAPAQDIWIAEHKDDLGVAVSMGVGGAFDHVVGIRRRAPAWLIRLNLEWLWRLLTQPWRWRRQLDLPRFVWAVMRSGK